VFYFGAGNNGAKLCHSRAIQAEFLWNGIVFCDAESGLGRGGLHFPN